MASAKTAIAKKAPSTKKSKSHPPYVEMIKEAIVALKERTGSSQYAIAKHIEDHQKDLPANFKKLLLLQLKKLVAAGKLTKVKNSFKLASGEKPKAEKKAVPAQKAPAAKKAAKSGSQVKATKVVAKAKAVVKTKKVVVKKATPLKAVAKKPKSIRSPAKKVAAKKGKK
ncbi:histone H1-like [Cynara cardunculus var. scolymus]|uniref:Histone H1/H5 n=1 Tax=Cynara cardunculus var. scolymus TaxID=59895 RepID=A0A103Y1H1_CYNCS|nr:histone H1-like [Cynara cardunculus var. scolymus]KVI00794.1 Histone H1/H5 [Cynara cardunculus var. scolymus]